MGGETVQGLVSEPPHLPQRVSGWDLIFCGDVREQGPGSFLLTAHPFSAYPILPQAPHFFISLLVAQFLLKPFVLLLILLFPVLVGRQVVHRQQLPGIGIPGGQTLPPCLLMEQSPLFAISTQLGILSTMAFSMSWNLTVTPEFRLIFDYGQNLLL